MKNEVKKIQAVAYNGARTVYLMQLKIVQEIHELLNWPKLAQIPVSQILFHRNISLRDLYKMTLV